MFLPVSLVAYFTHTIGKVPVVDPAEFQHFSLLLINFLRHSLPQSDRDFANRSNSSPLFLATDVEGTNLKLAYLRIFSLVFYFNLLYTRMYLIFYKISLSWYLWKAQSIFFPSFLGRHFFPRRMKIKYGLLYTSWCISLQSVARQQ